MDKILKNMDLNDDLKPEENSRTSTPDKHVPEASDTFRRVLEQFKPPQEQSLTFDAIDSERLDCLDGVGRIRTHHVGSQKRDRRFSVDVLNLRKGDAIGVDDSDSEKENPKPRRGRRKSVQWIDERFVAPVAHEPTDNEKHQARLFMKTVPKSILKHSANDIVLLSDQ
ncbi:unnamed protein product [Mytilus edulis]|uniref:Uncharacterized protein n=1 Tax=Mytilus edulis TaxID=6550 RepID=A0A8S3RUZ2_MYTED|nr:unnamed protein product [Mytilus edulis]